jgi:hypothetical protein
MFMTASRQKKALAASSYERKGVGTRDSEDGRMFRVRRFMTHI